jgi:hypothetical protein
MNPVPACGHGLTKKEAAKDLSSILHTQEHFPEGWSRHKRMYYDKELRCYYFEYWDGGMRVVQFSFKNNRYVAYEGQYFHRQDLIEEERRHRAKRKKRRHRRGK